MSRSRIFVSLGGQDDNLGDSVLRRGLVEALTSDDVDVHVFVGAHSPGYLAGLGLRGTEVVYRDYSVWRRRALISALTRRTMYVHNAGEIQANSARTRNSLFELAVAALTCARGVRPILVGVGLRDPSRSIPWIVRYSFGLCRPLVWRDAETAEAIGVGRAGPDWAFGLGGSAPEGDRDYVAIGMRFDRPPLTDETIELISSEIRDLGLRPLVVSQVIRDVEPNEELAAKLECEHITWAPGVDHARQEQIVRGAYRRSAAVVSDRLHALIIGGTEGAAIVPLVTMPDRKLGRTLSAGGLHVRVAVTDDGPGAEYPLGLRHLLLGAGDQQRQIQLAAARVHAVATEIAGAVRHLARGPR